jgi:hypothetical protein
MTGDVDPDGRVCVLGRGWTVEATAERFQVDARTVVSGVTSSSPKETTDCWTGRLGHISSPNRTSRQLRRRVVRLRCKRCWGADRSVYVLRRDASVTDVVNMTAIAVAEAQRRG